MEPASIVAEITLSQNRPNPFKPATDIEYGLPEACFVDLAVFDVTGKRVRTLVNGQQPAGHRVVRWNGKNDSGAAVSAGVYFCKLATESENFSRAMDDGFFLFVEATDKQFDEVGTSKFLSDIGGKSVETVRE